AANRSRDRCGETPAAGLSTAARITTPLSLSPRNRRRLYPAAALPRLLPPNPAGAGAAILVEPDCRRRIDEIRGAGGVDQLARDHRLDAAIATQRQDLVDEIARVAGAKWPAGRPIVPPLEVGDHHLVKTELPALAVHLENACELLQRRIADRNLVRDSAQKR